MMALWLALLLAPATLAVDYSFTTALDAGEEQCFHENVKPGKDIVIDMEFQVVSGGGLDIDYTVKDPRGKIVDSGIRKRDGVFEDEDPLPGVWEFCLSNKFSTMTEKDVFFMLTIDYPYEYDEEEAADDSIDYIEDSANKIHGHLLHITRVQSHLRAREHRHRATAEFICSRVMFVSAFETVIIVIVGVAQVFVIRYFFSADKRRPEL
eukprot:TRINITY_DN8548_c0_g2_i1.p1 TRINITY_DN8548_c0_g2~~TRINITY_DN8548_c0_g2_i1.p1  ORF type:complete len:208 (+),score=39.95 TRINITY_DN8548_c0_g2_i1:1491-2114(+)